MDREKRQKRLNLKTLEYDNKAPKQQNVKNNKKIGNIEVLKGLSGVILLLIIISILFYLVLSKKHNPKYIVKDFYNIAKEDINKAKSKYNEKTDFNEEVDKILSSRFKYNILEVKDITTPKQKENKTKVVEVKTKLSNVNKRQAKTGASNKVSENVKLGSDEYNKEYLAKLKEVVKEAPLEEKETVVRLKNENGKWYIIDSGSTDLI